MRDVYIDACTLINLRNGDALSYILALGCKIFYCGEVVKGECDVSQRFLDKYFTAGGLNRPSTEISANMYVKYLTHYQLGEGETECLVHAKATDSIACSDDKKAREMFEKELGRHRVMGSIGLLRNCIDCDYLSRSRSEDIYKSMKSAGGYLPNFSNTLFR